MQAVLEGDCDEGDEINSSNDKKSLSLIKKHKERILSRLGCVFWCSGGKSKVYFHTIQWLENKFICFTYKHKVKIIYFGHNSNFKIKNSETDTPLGDLI